MRIKCPECESILSLTLPKPGSYRPTCKQCKQPFRLKVTADDPPKIGVGRVSKGAASDAAPIIKPAPATETSGGNANGSATDATMDGTVNEVEATIDASIASITSATVGAASDATMDPSATAVSGTVVARPGNSTPSPTVVSSSRKVARRQEQEGGSDPAETPQRLGGYRIVRLLGRGAMGAVYEAKQISLDRQVALKTIRDRLASNPASLARFVREAYAAAQLTHHNVVQIYDFGEDGGKHFFSMEWVRGGPLDQVVRQKGSLDPRLAAGYALQAARGLQFAHRHGMVHRDVKPANLLLSDEGVVKVADLGLVKIPDHAEIESVGGDGTSGSLSSGTEVTMQGTAVGTPAYMAPEQTVNAAGVDHRADIYSLGCTLFYLLTGRPPFDGSVATEVMAQHANQTAPDVDVVNPRVPKPLADIVRRLMAKRPSDRYPSLVECIDDLESFLGLSTDGEFSPTSAQADAWEKIARDYASATALRRLDSPLLVGTALVSVILTFISFWMGFGWWLMGVSMLTVAVALPIALTGSRSPVNGRIRSWIGSLSLVDWAAGVIGVTLFLLVVVVAGMWSGLIVGGVIGAAAGAAYHFGIVNTTLKRSERVVNDAERFVRDLRISGADESGLRSFASRYAGKRWHGLYEKLFGYDALLEIRQTLKADRSFPHVTSGSSLRDKLCANLAARTLANRKALDQKRLAKVEQRGLQSEGLSAAEAQDRSWAMARATMEMAQVSATIHTSDAEAAAEEKRRKMKAMLADARSGKHKVERDQLGPIRFALGGQTRLIVGCVLLAIFAIWGNSQGLFDSIKDIETLKQIGTGNVDIAELRSAVRDAAVSANQAETPSSVMGSTVTPWSIAIAGLLMTLSAFVSGWRMSIPAIIATLVILLGPSLGIPAWSESIPSWIVSALIGLVLYVPGILFGETKN